MRNSRRTILFLFILLIAGGCSTTQGMRIKEAWVRPTDLGGNSAAYFVIENRGESDRLLFVETEIASQTQLHLSQIDDDGTVSMEPQDSVVLPSRSKISFEPGGYHIMLLDLKRNLTAGEAIELQFVFERQEPIKVEAEVRSQ